MSSGDAQPLRVLPGSKSKIRNRPAAARINAAARFLLIRWHAYRRGLPCTLE
jgi:hypothetical protein